jgi:hypothetical protein
VTSYLCTKHARDTFGAARAEFEAFAKDPTTLAHAGYKPPPPKGATEADVLDNAAAVAEAKGFLDYAVASGRRATPHR